MNTDKRIDSLEKTDDIALSIAQSMTKTLAAHLARIEALEKETRDIIETLNMTGHNILDGRDSLMNRVQYLESQLSCKHGESAGEKS